jgi:hypothetical protein
MGMNVEICNEGHGPDYFVFLHSMSSASFAAKAARLKWESKKGKGE